MRRTYLLLGIFLMIGGRSVLAEQEKLEIACFTSDATPPMNHPLSGGWIKPVLGNDDPELCKGIVLRDSGGVYVLCAVDWCTLHNEAYDLFREKVARGAGTTPSRVAVQCVHQHNSPTIDLNAQKLLSKYDKSPPHLDIAWYETVTTNAEEAAKDAMHHFQPVTEIATGMAKVDRVASTRRVKAPDGSIKIRFSSAPDPELRAADEGFIDPWLRTIAFYDGQRPVAQLHYYATHPQSYYGDGRTTWDVPGIARERLQKDSGVFQVYFTGCAGDITMGKYNDGKPERRKELAERLHDGMIRSIASLKKEPISHIDWKTHQVHFPILKDDRFNEDQLRKIVADDAAPSQQRLMAAIDISWIERNKQKRGIEISALYLGKVCIVHLPGEPFVKFQLEAQEARPDLFVAVAGYGDGGPGYICTQKSFAEGGYEPTASNIAPDSEQIMSDSIRELMGRPTK